MSKKRKKTGFDAFGRHIVKHRISLRRECNVVEKWRHPVSERGYVLPERFPRANVTLC